MEWWNAYTVRIGGAACAALLIYFGKHGYKTGWYNWADSIAGGAQSIHTLRDAAEQANTREAQVSTMQEFLEGVARVRLRRNFIVLASAGLLLQFALLIILEAQGHGWTPLVKYGDTLQTLAAIWLGIVSVPTVKLFFDVYHHGSPKQIIERRRQPTGGTHTPAIPPAPRMPTFGNQAGNGADPQSARPFNTTPTTPAPPPADSNPITVTSRILLRIQSGGQTIIVALTEKKEDELTIKSPQWLDSRVLVIQEGLTVTFIVHSCQWCKEDGTYSATLKEVA